MMDRRPKTLTYMRYLVRFFPLLLNKISSRLWLLFNHLRNRASNWLDNWASMRFPRLCMKKRVHKAPCKVYEDISEYDLLHKNKTLHILLENSIWISRKILIWDAAKRFFFLSEYLRKVKKCIHCSIFFRYLQKIYTN